MVSLVGTTMVISAVFLVYYALYGITLIASTEACDAQHANAKRTAWISIGVAVVLAVALIFFSRTVSEAWEKVEQDVKDAPQAGLVQFEQSDALAQWAGRGLTAGAAAAILFGIVFYWMKLKALGPLETNCPKEKSGFWASIRDGLKSVEFLVYAVMALLLANVAYAFHSWNKLHSVKSADEREHLAAKAEQHAEAQGERAKAAFDRRVAMKQVHGEAMEHPEGRELWGKDLDYQGAYVGRVQDAKQRIKEAGAKVLAKAQTTARNARVLGAGVRGTFGQRASQQSSYQPSLRSSAGDSAGGFGGSSGGAASRASERQLASMSTKHFVGEPVQPKSHGSAFPGQKWAHASSKSQVHQGKSAGGHHEV